MGLLDLPNELLLSIAQYLKYHWNISALSQANRRLYLLLDNYVYQFCQDHFGGSLGKGLQWAVEHGSESLTRKMLDAGADPLIQLSTSPLTAMTRAVKNQHAGILRLFMERGFAIPAWITIGYHYHHLLGVAADNGHLSVVQLILECEHGELPGPGHWGHTIGDAAERGRLSVVGALMEGL